MTTLSWNRWIEHSLLLVGRDATKGAVDEVRTALELIDPDEVRLDAPGVDSDRRVHHDTYFGVFAEAGLDRPLADALYSVESDYRHNPFATDVAPTLTRLKRDGRKIAIVSDEPFLDIRPAFAAAGMAELVDAFVLSFEVGVQKPDRQMFETALTALGVSATETLMVGDRSHPDGGAAEAGITTLLLPPLRGVTDQRLHRVLSLASTA